MKKKTIILLLCMTLAASAGCGSKNNSDVSGTETVESTEKTGILSTDIEYDVDECVTLGDYSNIEVTLNPADYVVDEAAINSYVDQMIQYYKAYVPDESKTVVEKGDVVDADYVGKKDGVAFDGGSAEHTMIDTAANADAASGNGYIDGFSDGLVGASVGDTVDSEVTFPEDYQSEELKGQTVTFTFTIHAIEKKVTRDTIDDAYVKENFDVDTVEEYYKQVEKELTQQAEYAKQSDVRTKVIDAATELCSVTLPEGLLDARVNEYISNFEKQNCTDGTTLADYLQKNYNSTEEEFRTEIQGYMEDNLKQELIFEAIAKKENIEFDQSEYDTYMQNLVSNMGASSADEIYETYGADKESGEKYLKKIFLGNQACNKISENAKVNYSEEDAQDTEADTEASSGEDTQQ